jgi:GNAT superfamily N-acetyltransferase
MHAEVCIDDVDATYRRALAAGDIGAGASAEGRRGQTRLMIEIALFDPRDYDEVMALWRETEGLTLGLGRALAERAVGALGALGIEKCHLMVRQENAPARAFWQRLGWSERDDIILMSHAESDTANA